MIVETIRYFFNLKRAQISIFSRKFCKETTSNRLEKIQNFARIMTSFYLLTQNWRINNVEEEKKQVENLVKESLTGDDNELGTTFKILGVTWDGKPHQFEFRQDVNQAPMQQEEQIEIEEISIFEEIENVRHKTLTK